MDRTDEGHTRVTDEGLSRRLTSRQLTMIAMGGAIGVGLFLGSTVTIGLAGPGVILTYVVGAAIALVVGYVLAEMAVIHPQAGSFGVYAERYLSPCTAPESSGSPRCVISIVFRQPGAWLWRRRSSW